MEKLKVDRWYVIKFTDKEFGVPLNEIMRMDLKTIVMGGYRAKLLKYVEDTSMNELITAQKDSTYQW